MKTDTAERIFSPAVRRIVIEAGPHFAWDAASARAAAKDDGMAMDILWYAAALGVLAYDDVQTMVFTMRGQMCAVHPSERLITVNPAMCRLCAGLL